MNAVRFQKMKRVILILALLTGGCSFGHPPVASSSDDQREQWPDRYSWWENFIRDNAKGNGFNGANSNHVDFVVLLGYRESFPRVHNLTPFVITRSRLAGSADIPDLSGQGYVLQSDGLVDRICAHTSPTNQSPAEIWLAAFCSSNHVVRGFRSFGPDLFRGLPRVGGEPITNRIQLILPYFEIDESTDQMRYNPNR